MIGHIDWLVNLFTRKSSSVDPIVYITYFQSAFILYEHFFSEHVISFISMHYAKTLTSERHVIANNATHL